MALRRIRRALEDLVAQLGPRISPAARATADSAAEVDKLDLAATWRDPEIETAWSAAERLVAPLGLSAQGGMNPGDRRALYYLVRHLGPERVLERGRRLPAIRMMVSATTPVRDPSPPPPGRRRRPAPARHHSRQ